MKQVTASRLDSDPDVALWMALLPVVGLIALLAANVYLYGADASYGPNQIALLMATAIAATVGFTYRVPVGKMVAGIQSSIGTSVVAMLILLLIGALTGTWMISGVVPAMIYYGLEVFSPELFLFATVIICSVVSVVTGSSWSTVATVGIALLGIGRALGISDGLIAGAIISGAYFGDKISPLSDTTNLASAMAGTDLITHVRYMLWTTVPSLAITLVIFLVIGFVSEPEELVSGNSLLKQEIASRFNLNPAIFLVPFSVLVMVVLKVDALVALFIGAVAGGLVAIVLQPNVVTQVAGLDNVTVTRLHSDGTQTTETVPPPYLKRAYMAFVNSMSIKTELISVDQIDDLQARKQSLEEIIDINAKQSDRNSAERSIVQSQLAQANAEIAASQLLIGKGMAGMLNTVWLIITAMCFGGVMEACGLLRRITRPLVEFAKSTGSLITTTAGSCVLVNLTASDQYLAIVVPGRMFRETFRERGLAPENLSRTLEDAGTVTSVLIPWNTCGATQQGVLGIDVLVFAPYCFFNLISPLMTILFAWLNIRIAKLSPTATEIQAADQNSRSGMES